MSRHDRTRLNRIEKGLCPTCGKPYQGESYSCPSCKEAMRVRSQGRRTSRKQAGLCILCGVTCGETRCGSCKEKRRKKNHQMNAAGKCATCRETLDTKATICVACSAERKKRQQTLRVRRGSLKLCRECGVPAIYGIYCFDHWLVNMAATNTGHRKNATMLKEIWNKQEGRCALTGFPLQLGESASIDHIVPSTRGGTNAESNLAWVAWKANQSKTDMTRDEFISFCRLVIAVADGVPPSEYSPEMTALLKLRHLEKAEQAP